jgi:hypothetical protein
VKETNGKATVALVVQISAIVVAIVGAVSTPLILMYAHMVATDEKLGEIETQFKALDQIGNLHTAHQARVNALLWQHTYGEPYPSDIYFPEISKERK